MSEKSRPEFPKFLEFLEQQFDEAKGKKMPEWLKGKTKKMSDCDDEDEVEDDDVVDDEKVDDDDEEEVDDDGEEKKELKFQKKSKK